MCIASVMESEYLDWLLSDDPPKSCGRGRGLRRSCKAVMDIILYILDEPISKADKKRLLKSLLPKRAISTLLRCESVNPTGLLREFDPLHTTEKRKHALKWADLVPLLATANKSSPPPYELVKQQAGILKEYKAVVPVGHRQEADALAFLHAIVPGTAAVSKNELQMEGGIKVSLILEAELEKFSKNGDSITTKPFFHSGSAEPVLHTEEIQGRLNGAVNKIMERLEGFTNEGSG
jgi:hypothetical protein